MDKIVVLNMLVPRTDKYAESVKKLNNMLLELSKKLQVAPIFHHNITDKHIADGVHLSRDGTNIYSSNITEFIDMFVSKIYPYGYNTSG